MTMVKLPRMKRGEAMMERVPISKFKATCLALLDQVKRTGRPILVTRRGEPIAQIQPPPPPQRPASWLGSFRDSGRIVGDIVSPAGEEEMWEVLSPHRNP
jgi:prevent-host-death family protein